MSAESPSTTTPRRWRLRFTLRVLLVVVAAVCVFLAIWTQRARQQRRVVERLRQSSRTTIHYDFQFKNGRARIDDRSGQYEESKVPAFLREAFGTDFFHTLTAVYSSDPKIIKELPDLPSLELLSLDSDSLVDSDLAPVPEIHGLRSVFIQGDIRNPHSTTHVSDDSLAMIPRLRHIKEVFLCGDGFTRQGIISLASARNLEWVWLEGCTAGVDRSALDALKNLPRLRYLHVSQGRGRERKTVEEWSPE